MHEQQVDYLVGINAVGGIASWAEPARLVCPTQLVDYSWGRAHTFADGQSGPLQHVEFTDPLDAEVRSRLLEAAAQLGIECHPAGVYGVTQGPRLETAAEIDRMERDGCDVVGMTAMPEAGLARELGIAYAICAVVVNWAAGRGGAGQGIHDEIRASIERGMAQVQRLVSAL
jgi:purine nucleoside phosphorylase